MFGRNLRNARKNKGYTLEELSELYNKTYSAGMNKGTLSKYENEKQEPLITVVANLAALLDIPIDFLFDSDTKLEKRPTPSDLSNFEQILLLHYRNADDIDKKMVCRILRLNSDEGEYPCSKKIVSVNRPDQSHLEPVAAHDRTDIEITDEMRKYDNDIMDNDEFWK